MNAKINIKKIIPIAILIIIVLVVILSSFYTIPSGYVGVKTQFGAVTGEEVQPGLQMKIPFIQNVHKLNCKVQKIEADSNAASKDLQTINSKIAVNFFINPAMANEIFKDVGMNYVDVIINPAIQEVVKSVSANYTAEELITKRSEVSIAMKEELSNKIKNKGITVNDFNVINFEFSEEFNKAIEQKQVAQQNALKAEQDLARIKIEAEQKVVQAQAEADSLKAQRQEITQELLELRKIEAQLKAIEKWNGQLPNYNGGDSVPFINIK